MNSSGPLSEVVGIRDKLLKESVIPLTLAAKITRAMRDGRVTSKDQLKAIIEDAGLQLQIESFFTQEAHAFVKEAMAPS